MQDVAIKPMNMDRVTGLFGGERRDRFEQTAATARRLLDGRVVWNVNATAHGGGVAEMLQTLLGYVRGVGVDTRWPVLSAPPEFFVVTKRIHNLLHGEAGDGGPLGGAESEVVAAEWATNLAELSRRVRPRDVVVLHDPQTAGMVDGLRAAGALVVWRCHIGRDTANRLTDRGWTFLRAPPRERRRVRVLAPDLRPGLDPTPEGARHHALDRPLQSQELSAQRRPGPDDSVPGWSGRRGGRHGRRDLRAAGRHDRRNVAAQWSPPRRAGPPRPREVRRTGQSVGQAQGHVRPADRLRRIDGRPARRRAPDARGSGGLRSVRRPGGCLGAG